MRDLDGLTAEDLLRIAPDQPERLFTGNAEEAKREYRRLAMRWHPDRNSEAAAEAVFARISALHAEAEHRFDTGAWRPSAAVIDGQSAVRLVAADGRSFRVRPRLVRATEIGEAYVADTVVAYLVRPDAADLADAALRIIADLPYAADDGGRMRADFAPLLPRVEVAFETADGGRALVLRKDPDAVPLANLVAHCGGRLDPRHAAWIVGCLMNLSCWLAWAGLQHGAVAAGECFVSARRHSISLLGGWWYATRFGERLRAAPARTVACAPSDVVVSKTADRRVDLELVRALGREILGDPVGVRLAADPDVPRPMTDWLRSASKGDAVAEYAEWRRVLEASFGPRRFVQLDVAPDAVYAFARRT